MQECKLRAAQGVLGVECDGERCIFWRIAEHVGLEAPANGCALQHFDLVNGDDTRVRWLASVKARVDSLLLDSED